MERVVDPGAASDLALLGLLVPDDDTAAEPAIDPTDTTRTTVRKTLPDGSIPNLKSFW